MILTEMEYIKIIKNHPYIININCIETSSNYRKYHKLYGICYTLFGNCWGKYPFIWRELRWQDAISNRTNVSIIFNNIEDITLVKLIWAQYT